jgi:predicted HicB family RNase H-like nuclease
MLSLAGNIEEIMEKMTDEEAFALAEYYAQNPPKVDPSKARKRNLMVRVDDVTAKHLVEMAKTSNKKPEEIIESMVREKIAEPVAAQ